MKLSKDSWLEKKKNWGGLQLVVMIWLFLKYSTERIFDRLSILTVITIWYHACLISLLHACNKVVFFTTEGTLLHEISFHWGSVVRH